MDEHTPKESEERNLEKKLNDVINAFGNTDSKKDTVLRPSAGAYITFSVAAFLCLESLHYIKNSIQDFSPVRVQTNAVSSSPQYLVDINGDGRVDFLYQEVEQLAADKLSSGRMETFYVVYARESLGDGKWKKPYRLFVTSKDPQYPFDFSEGLSEELNRLEELKKQLMQR